MKQPKASHRKVELGVRRLEYRKHAHPYPSPWQPMSPTQRVLIRKLTGKQYPHNLVTHGQADKIIKAILSRTPSPTQKHADAVALALTTTLTDNLQPLQKLGNLYINTTLPKHTPRQNARVRIKQRTWFYSWAKNALQTSGLTIILPFRTNDELARQIYEKVYCESINSAFGFETILLH